MLLTPRNVLLSFALAAAWIALVIAASIVYRRIKGKPIFRPRIEHPLFLETWRSGRSLRNLVTRFGGARNCLWVAVTEDSLRVGPHFPFNLMFLPEIYGLECMIPGSAIRSVERRGGLLDADRVRVSFERVVGDVEEFEFSPRDPEAFVRAVAAVRGAAARGRDTHCCL
jgi:hypothetical protein